MRVMTLKDIMSETGKAERTLRVMVAKKELEWTGELRGREKLYYYPPGGVDKPVEVVQGKVSIDPNKMVEDQPGGETLHMLKESVRSGEITLEQSKRLADMAENLRKAGEIMTHEEAGEMTRELDIKKAGLDARESEMDKLEKKRGQSWATFKDEKEELLARARKVELVEAWCNGTAKALTDSAVWSEAYHAQVSELPEWPNEEVDINEMLSSWGAKKKPKGMGKKAKKQDSMYNDETEE